MANVLVKAIAGMGSIDLFARDKAGALKSGTFVGNPFYIDYQFARVLVADKWKVQAGGLPQGSFLLAYYENEASVHEALLLRVLGPSVLPTDQDITRSMIEYYKDGLRTTGEDAQLDTFTRLEFSFSGLECRILGSFYRDAHGDMRFGADVENFFSAHNYSVVKPTSKVLEFIVNFREGVTAGNPNDIRIGSVRYSSSRRFQDDLNPVPVYVRADDFIGKRTALFGMTRTGKSNSVKKIIEATVALSDRAPRKPNEKAVDHVDALEPFTAENLPKYPVGQIIFDMNGEYANPNLQDEGTAIFELFAERTVRYSTVDKGDGFKVMKVNFFNDVLRGFQLATKYLEDDTADYVRSVCSIDLTPPEDGSDFSETTRFERRKAVYLCCLHAAGFKAPAGFKVTFSGAKDLNKKIESISKDPKNGLSLDEAVAWWTEVWDLYAKESFFEDYWKKKGKRWIDEDLEALLIFLTRRSKPGGNANISGYRKLRGLIDLHTDTTDAPFQDEIVRELREGNIVIVDLSQGAPEIQRTYTDDLCQHIFRDAMARFVQNLPNNFIQLYFEEAHNLFPKKEDKDLSQVYNRLAKEGAKLHLGLFYATQEVSSISGNILKNTQNWFIAHLNNEDEVKEIRKYYDFGDFTESLVRFSASNDKGFVRMKTYSNPFVVPVQVDRFPSSRKEE